MRTLKADKVVNALASIGLNLQEYKKPFGGKRVVSLAKTRSGDGLHYWFPENAEYKVSTNKRKKQAVVVIKEKPRAVPNETFSVCVGELPQPQIDKLENMSYKDVLKNYPNVSSSNDIKQGNCKTHVEGATFHPQVVSRVVTSYGETYIKLKGVSRTRTTTTTFLLGVDESKHFISVLKRPVSTVEEAHKELRPKGISNKAIRQGEWFFDPVSEDLVERIKKGHTRKRNLKLSNGSGWYNDDFNPNRLEEGSSHSAKTIYTYKKQRYAMGDVTDHRKGYHEKLILDTPHRIVRNNEKNLIQVRNYD